MKKINYWLATALLIVVVGCSKEELTPSEDTSTNSNRLKSEIKKTPMPVPPCRACPPGPFVNGWCKACPPINRYPK